MSAEIEIRRMKGLSKCFDEEVTGVFVDAYYDLLSTIEKDKEKLVKVFKHTFVREVFYLALLNGKVVGMLACSTNRKRGLKFDRTIFIEHFGFFKGNFIYYSLRNEFETPLDYNNSTAYIEVVATTSEARGKGVATSLFNHVIKNTYYKEFILEVMDTNEKAKRIYERLGFEEFKRIPATYLQQKFFNERIYMKLITNKYEIGDK